MPLDIFPNTAPYPRASLGWDGTEFRVARCNAAGTRIVRGEDQLFSFLNIYGEKLQHTMAGAGDRTMLGASPPADEVWVVTSLCAFNSSGGCTYIQVGIRHGVIERICDVVTPGAANEPAKYSGWIPLLENDEIYAFFVGAAGGDVLYLYSTGFKMTLEV